MSEQKILGEIRNIADYHAIARARADELSLTREGLDRLAGFGSGHASKLLASIPTKRVGPVTFGTLNGALGMKLVAVEDLESMQAHAVVRSANQRTRPGRDENDVMTMGELKARIISRQCKKAVRARNAKLSPEDRSRICRVAAKARWSRLDAAGRKTAIAPLAKGYRAHVVRRRKRASQAGV